jgi:hypothetical protein
MINCAIPNSVLRCYAGMRWAKSWAMVLAEARVSLASASSYSFLKSAVTAYIRRVLRGGGVEPGGQR